MAKHEQWDVRIATPVGDQRMTVVLAQDTNGAWEGNARSAGDDMPLTSLFVTDTRMSWHLELRHPIRLSLQFDVEVDATTLSGTATAGVFLRSKVTGQRRLNDQPIS